jgi:hypothetical protein
MGIGRADYGSVRQAIHNRQLYYSTNQNCFQSFAVGINYFLSQTNVLIIALKADKASLVNDGIK